MHKLIIAFFLMYALTWSAVPQNNERITDKQQLMKASTPEEVGFSSERLKNIDFFFNNCIEQKILPHVQAYISRHGKIVYFQSFGWKDLDKKIELENSDIFRLASQTKAVTTAALMILFEEGKLNLSDPVSKYIPEFKNLKVQKIMGTNYTADNLEDAKREITIHNLLTHTSGIPYWYDPGVFKIVTSPGITLANVTLEEFIKEIAKMPLVHQPGAAITYGYNLDAVGLIIEKISGMKLNEFFKKNIFEPLQMNDTYFYLPDSKTNRLVTLFEKEKEEGPITNSKDNLFCNYPIKGAKSFFSGGAGLVGTLEDYAKFCQMLINGGSFNNKLILSRKSVEMMTKNQVGDLPLMETGDQFGFGFQILTDIGLKNILGSAGSYKWGGAYGTEYLIDPKEDLVLIIYSNIRPFAGKMDILNKYRTLVYQALIN